MTGVVKEFPVPSDVPPVGAAYQLIVPDEAEATRVTVPGPQRVAGMVEIIDGVTLIVAIIAVLAAVVQVFIVAST